MHYLLLLVFMSLMFSSCGGGKSTATLTVDRGFAVANSSFSGGIYITGTKTDGSESFTATIPSGNSTTVSISLGNWDIKVVGWDGSGVMQGTPYCAYESNYAFTKQGQNLSLSTNTSNCFVSNISGTNQQVSGTWKSFVVNTCGSMANPSYSNLTTVTGSYDPCANYQTEYRKTYPYYKFHLMNQSAGGSRTPVLASSCLPAQSQVSGIMFPNRMPVTLKFYKDAACVQEVDEYVFTKGLDGSLANRPTDKFDWAVTADSTNFFITLPSGASKRGTTAFHTETPLFQCIRGGLLVPCGSLPAGNANTYYLDPDTYAIIRVPQTTCPGLSSITGTGGVTLKVASCEAKEGNLFITLKATNTTPVTGTISVNGTSYSVQVGNTNTGYTNDRVREAYKILKRTVGVKQKTYFDNSLADDFDEEDNDQIGSLDSAIYDISSMGAGGVFYDMYTQCTVSPLAQVFNTYQKNGITYNVALSGLSGTAQESPGYTSKANQPEWMTPQANYNRRIVVRKLSGGALTTEKIIDFSCDNFNTDAVVYTPSSPQVRNGRIEEQRTTAGSDRISTLKRIIYWNHSQSDKARFDVYRSKKVTSGSGTIQRMETNFYRVSKVAGDSIFRVKAMSYEVVRNGSSYDERVVEGEVDSKEVSPNVTYAYKKFYDLKIGGVSVGSIFNTDLYQAELRKVRTGYKPSLSLEAQNHISSTTTDFVEAKPDASSLIIRYTDGNLIHEETDAITAELVATAISPNGMKKMVVASVGTDIYIYKISAAGVDTALFSTGATVTSLKVSVLNDGNYLFAYLTSASQGNLNWVPGDFTGIGSLATTPYTTFGHKSLALFTDGTYHYLLTDRIGSTQSFLDICRVNASQTCGFNTISSKVSIAGHKDVSGMVTSSEISVTYSFDGVYSYQPFTLSVANVLTFGTLVSKPQVSVVNYTPSQYMMMDESAVYRSTGLTNFSLDYPFYLPSMSAFEMKLIYLKSSTMEANFTSGFTTLTI